MKDSENKFKISGKTKSRAYQFIKSLMSDDIDPTKIHNLMDAIREHVDKDVAGNILFDLLKNSKDHDGDKHFYSTWFGPVEFVYNNHVFKILTNYLEEEDMRGWARFGDDHDWDEWNKTTNKPLSRPELESVKNNGYNQLIYFKYYADNAQRRKTKKFVEDLFKRIQNTQKKKNAKNG